MQFSRSPWGPICHLSLGRSTDYGTFYNYESSFFLITRCSGLLARNSTNSKTPVASRFGLFGICGIRTCDLMEAKHFSSHTHLAKPLGIPICGAVAGIRPPHSRYWIIALSKIKGQTLYFFHQKRYLFNLLKLLWFKSYQFTMPKIKRLNMKPKLASFGSSLTRKKTTDSSTIYHTARQATPRSSLYSLTRQLISVTCKKEACSNSYLNPSSNLHQTIHSLTKQWLEQGVISLY